MELEETVIFLMKVVKEYKTYGDLDNPEFEDTKKIAKSIETVLQALESYKKRYELAIEQNVKDYKNSIPKKKIEDKILELQEAIALENNSMYGRGDEEYIKEIELKIIAYKELLEDK